MLNNSIISTEDEYFFKIDDMKDVGLRLDKFLSNSIPFSRSIIQKWLQQDLVNVNGTLQANKYKIKIGDEVYIKTIASPQDLAFNPEKIELDMLYNDNDICIINKPIGLVVHPGPGNWSGTLLNGLLYHFPQNSALPRAGIVHRLDKMTSGLMVIAKTLTSQNNLVQAIQDRKIKRQYLAITQGNTLLYGTINQPIGRHPVHKTRMAVCHNGKNAITHYKKLANLPIQGTTNQSTTLIECTLDTGRTHQIRVHMAHIGHALIGDVVYNQQDKSSVFYAQERQALHAVRLELNHPITNEQIKINAVPQDNLMLEELDKFSYLLNYDIYRGE